MFQNPESLARIFVWTNIVLGAILFSAVVVKNVLEKNRLKRLIADATKFTLNMGGLTPQELEVAYINAGWPADTVELWWCIDLLRNAVLLPTSQDIKLVAISVEKLMAPIYRRKKEPTVGEVCAKLRAMGLKPCPPETAFAWGCAYRKIMSPGHSTLFYMEPLHDHKTGPSLFVFEEARRVFGISPNMRYPFQRLYPNSCERWIVAMM